MSAKISVLHLRQEEGSGGGPEKTIFKTGCMINRDRFEYIIAYLRKHSAHLTPVAERITGSGLPYYELPGRRVFDLSQLRGTADIIRKMGVHILHCHDPKSDFYGLLLRRLVPRLILVGTHHGWVQRSWKGGFYLKADVFALKRFDSVIGVSEASAEKLRALKIRRVRVIRNAIDLSEWDPGLPHRPPPFQKCDPASFLVGFIGRLSREKGPLDFVRIASNLLQKEPCFEFLVAGEGPEEVPMKDLARSLGVDDRFHFVGQVRNEDMPPVFQALDVLLLPSHSEGLPNSILEACAMALPVVATNVGGVPEIVLPRHNGLLAPPGAIEMMSEHVRALRKDPRRLRLFGENGKLLAARRFSMEERVRKIEVLYEEVAGKSSP